MGINGEFNTGGGGGPRDGLASHPRRSKTTLSHFILLIPEINVLVYLLMLFEILTGREN